MAFSEPMFPNKFISLFLFIINMKTSAIAHGFLVFPLLIPITSQSAAIWSLSPIFHQKGRIMFISDPVFNDNKQFTVFI